MNYYLYKLRFKTAVHFGSSDSALSLQGTRDSFCADTLFSALCHTALALGGQERLNNLCFQAEQGQLLFSDAFPWHNEMLYLPKPFLNPVPRVQDPSLNPLELRDGSRKRKALKKLAWIAVEEMSLYLSSLSGNGDFTVADSDVAFGRYTESTKVAIKGQDEPEPYQVGLYQFADKCGLYFIAGCASELQQAELHQLLAGLGETGMGGKVSSGYGKFEIDDELDLAEPFDEPTCWLAHALTRTQSGRYMLLTSSLPSDEELAEVLRGAAFQLTRRAGFVQSHSYAETSLKKQTQFFLAAGSTVSCRFKPRLYNVGHKGSHPVYRLSAPVFLGV